MTDQKKRELASSWLASFVIWEGDADDLEDIHHKMILMLMGSVK